MLKKASLAVRETSESGNERRFTQIPFTDFEHVAPIHGDGIGSSAGLSKINARQPCGKLLLRHGPAEQVPLGMITSLFEEHLPLRFFFDAFGEDLKFKAVGHGDDRPDDRGRFRLVSRCLG